MFDFFKKSGNGQSAVQTSVTAALATPRSLRDIAVNVANNPGIGKTFRHSKFFDKYRRIGSDPKKALGMLAKAGANVGLSFIPIPVVKDIAKALSTKLQEKVTEIYKTEKLNKYKNMPNNLTAEMSRKQREKLAKHTWKTLSIEDFDRYRWKIFHGMEVLQKNWNEHANYQALSESGSVCDSIVKAGSKLYYLEHRIEKMRSELDTVKEAIQYMEDWMQDVEKWVETSGYHEKLKDLDTEAPGWGLEHHVDCSDEFCCFGKRDWMYGAGGSRETLKKGLVMTGRLTAEILDVAPDVTDKGTFEGNTYKPG